MNKLIPWVLPKISTSMRSPQTGWTGWLAMKIMENGGNAIREAVGIQRMQLEATDTFLEIGAGHGFGLRAIGDSSSGNPKRIVCIEISPELRGKLEQVKQQVPYGDRVQIHGVDCKEMPFLEDSTVDKIFAMNVVYFLDPLDVYLKELHRVLKPNGFVVFGGVFDVVPHEGAFVNVNEASIVACMEAAGFEATTTKVYAKKESDPAQQPLYTELKGTKKPSL
jgi:SAM-dependent methyltransferase